MFSDVDEVDVSSPDLPFVFGRRSEPAQPQIPRFRAVAKKAKSFVALLTSEEQVCMPQISMNPVGWTSAKRMAHTFELPSAGPLRQKKKRCSHEEHVPRWIQGIRHFIHTGGRQAWSRIAGIAAK